ncbi:hypothetical protein AJ80_01258 [Polytolypa hystricis UAMH7299]|uniref:DUF7907 domain-containing protein n=1 Tax=Polytolypa hystricis (strain UAMH7299) TaxID=1447883 RepID=A0A2B7Z1W9_POLH7|nr:hypothetical protein AJ80_01258 [Polytolypa hystricis UAMH7299]
MFSFALLLLPLAYLADSMTIPALPRFYYLRTANSGVPAHDGLYVSSFHTGAGLSDAVVQPVRGDAAKGFLKDTHQQFQIGDELEWAMVMGVDANFSRWDSVHINAGRGTPGFSIDAGKLHWKEDGEFQGWLVCNWWHGIPQLFWIESPDVPYPEGCSRPVLEVEYI